MNGGWYPRLALLAGLILATIVVRSFFLRDSVPVASVALEGGLFAQRTENWFPEAAVQWTPPVAQSAGPRWIFELFTPPMVYFNRRRGRLTVDPPLPAPEEPPFGLVLHEIVRVPYSVQFRGYSGRRGSYSVELQHLGQGRYHRVRVGQRIPGTDIRLESFRTAPSPRVSGMGEAGSEAVGAVEVCLTDPERGFMILGQGERYLPEPHAVLIEEASGLRGMVPEGKGFASERYRYELRQVDTAAGEVEVAKLDLEGVLLASERLRVESEREEGP